MYIWREVDERSRVVIGLNSGVLLRGEKSPNGTREEQTDQRSTVNEGMNMMIKCD